MATIEASTAMKPVVLSSLDTAGPTTSTRRCVNPSPSASSHLLEGRLLGLLAAGLLLDADQHVGFGAEALDLHVAEPEPSSLSRSLRDIGRPGVGLHLDHRAALEVDAVVEALAKNSVSDSAMTTSESAKHEALVAHERQPQVVRKEVVAFEVGNQEHRSLSS